MAKSAANEDLVIQHRQGKISASKKKKSLYVEASGVVEADIETQNVEVSGQVTGNVTASTRSSSKRNAGWLGDIQRPLAF